MKIVINGRFLAQKTTGVQRVAIELTKYLDLIVEKGDITVVAPMDSFVELDLKNNELVKDGVNGKLFTVKDVVIGVNCVLNQLDEELIDSKNVIKTFKEAFSLDNMISKLEIAYGKNREEK